MMTEVIQVKRDFTAHDAAEIAGQCGGFESEVSFLHRAKAANAKSLMGVISLELRKGDEFTVFAEGKDEAAAMAAVMEYFK